MFRGSKKLVATTRFRVLLLAVAVVLVSLTVSPVAAQENGLLQTLRELRSATRDQQGAIITSVLEHSDDPARIQTADVSATPLPDERRLKKAAQGWSSWEATDESGVTRPYLMYLPEAVAGNARPPSAVMVHLHGAVSRDDFGSGVGATGYAGRFWPDLAEQFDWVVLCPLGRGDCAWWTEAGNAHINAVIRDFRRMASYPEDAVFLAGFSDGASGCYTRAMTAPDPFAGFLAMSGHPGVGTGQHQLYLPNLGMTPMIAAMTDKDGLYPTENILPHIEKANEFEAGVVTITGEGPHRPTYFAPNQQQFVDFIRNTRRQPRETIRWFSSDFQDGRCDRLELISMRADQRSEQLPDTNVLSAPRRLILGVQFASGNRVDAVVRGSAAENAGVQRGDRIRKLNGRRVSGIDSLRTALGGAVHGEPFTVSVERDDETIELEGNFPEAVRSPTYRRDRPTGFAEVKLSPGDDVQVRVDSAGVARMRLWLDSDLAVRQELNVEVNGVVSPVTVQRLSAREYLGRVAASLTSGPEFGFIEISPQK